MKIKVVSGSDNLPEKLELPLILEDYEGEVCLAVWGENGKIQLIGENGLVATETHKGLREYIVNGDYTISNKAICITN